MAATGPSNDYFCLGNIIKCITAYDKEIQGEVLSYNLENKVLTLSKCQHLLMFLLKIEIYIYITFFIFYSCFITLIFF